MFLTFAKTTTISRTPSTRAPVLILILISKTPSTLHRSSRCPRIASARCAKCGRRGSGSTSRCTRARARSTARRRTRARDGEDLEDLQLVRAEGLDLLLAHGVGQADDQLLAFGLERHAAHPELFEER